MAQPTAYTPTYDFSDLEAGDPDMATLGTKLDIEFAALNTTIDQILANLVLIQRDDGALKNRIVTAASLASDLSVGIEPATSWVAATDYEENDLVWQAGKLYICDVDHTSATFASDLSALKWTEIFDLADNLTELSGVFINTVVAKTANYTVLEADNGKAILADTTAGDITFTLPQISGLSAPNFFRVVLFKTVAANSMLLARSGADTINGAASQTFALQYTGVLVFSRSGDTDYKMIPFGIPLTGSIVAGMLASNAVENAKMADSAVDTAELAADAVTPAKVDPGQAGDVSSGSGTTTLDMTNYCYQKVTASGNITIDITPPASKPGVFILQAVNFGAHTITWTGVDDWPGGSAPALTAAGTDLLEFIADNDGVVRGFVVGKAFA